MQLAKWVAGITLVLTMAGCSGGQSASEPGSGTQPPASAAAPSTPIGRDTTSAPNGISCAIPDDPAAVALAERIIASGPRPADPTDVSSAWAIHDYRTGVTCSYLASQGFESASVIKVATVAAWLWQVEQGRLEFTEDEAWLAEAAITVSDNDSQELLWELIGGADAMAEFLAAAGMMQTVPSFIDGDWGLTSITADDQLRLVQLLNDATLLTREHSEYLLALMNQVDPEQFWGISAGAPADAYISLKNGWLDDPIAVPFRAPADDLDTESADPETAPSDDEWNDWGFEATWTNNSIGQVRATSAHYAMVVLSNGNATDEAGRERVNLIAAALAAALLAG